MFLPISVAEALDILSSVGSADQNRNLILAFFIYLFYVNIFIVRYLHIYTSFIASQLLGGGSNPPRRLCRVSESFHPFGSHKQIDYLSVSTLLSFFHISRSREDFGYFVFSQDLQSMNSYNGIS